MLPTGFGKSLIFQLFPRFVGISSKIVVSALFSIMRDQVEQLKRAGLSAKTIGILTIHMVRDGPLEKWYGGGGGVRQEIKNPRKLLIKIYIPTDFGQKKYAQRGSVQVRLLQINYEVNDKSRLEIERDFFF